MKSSTDPLGRISYTFYDDLNRVEHTEGPAVNNGFGVTATPVARFEYDEEGRQRLSVDPLGRATQFEYDEQGRRTKTIYPNGDTTHNLPAIYDIRGRVITQYDMRGNPTTFEYDSAGRQIKVTDALNHSTWTQYNAAGQRVTVKDALGRETKFTYDVFGRMIETQFPPAATGQPVTTKKTEYDKRGLSIAEIDQNNKRTEFVYDRLGRLTEVHDPLNGAAKPWKYGYDEAGNQTTQEDPLHRVTTWTYDGHGRRKSRTLPLGQTETMEYDTAGNLKRHIKFDGAVINYTHDSLNRQTLADYPVGTTDESATYDLAGQRLSTNDAYGVRTFEYDPRGRLAKVNHPTNEAISYSYDNAGNRIAVYTLDDGTTLTAQNMTYDALNRLETVYVEGIGTWTYGYDAVGNRSRLQAPNGVITDYTYDDLNRLKRIRTYKQIPGPGLGDLLDLHYTVDAVGNRTSITEKLNDAVMVITNYQYDDLYRLTREERIGPLAYIREYDYDEVGNREEQRTITGATTETRVYQYDANDRLITETAGAQVITYGYDANGNQNTKNDSVEGLSTYTWDARNKLIGAQVPGHPFIQMIYDSDGNRISRMSAGDGGTRYLVDMHNNTGYSQTIRETTPVADELTRYIIGMNLLAQIQSTGMKHYHYDGLGSIQAMSDNSGVFAGSNSYYGYGLPLYHAPEVAHRFLGEHYDDVLDLYYLRARFYDPQTGTFISNDPFIGVGRLPQSLNKYGYAHCNPTNNVDRSGRFVIEAILVSTVISEHFLNKIAPVRHVVDMLATLRVPVDVYVVLDPLDRRHQAMSDFDRQNQYSVAKNIWDQANVQLEFRPEIEISTTYPGLLEIDGSYWYGGNYNEVIDSRYAGSPVVVFTYNLTDRSDGVQGLTASSLNGAIIEGLAEQNVVGHELGHVFGLWHTLETLQPTNLMNHNPIEEESFMPKTDLTWMQRHNARERIKRMKWAK